MKIETTRFGRIEIDNKNIINFPKGIIGINDSGDFVVLPHKPGSPLMWLQSVNDPAIAFIIMNPLMFLPEYIRDVIRSSPWRIDDDSCGDFSIFGIVIIPKEDKKNVQMNLLAPIVINKKEQKGMQIVVQTGDYKVDEPIAPYIKKMTDNLMNKHKG